MEVTGTSGANGTLRGALVNASAKSARGALRMGAKALERGGFGGLEHALSQSARPEVAR